MYRSFADRVLGGVCGGLAQAIRLNAWLVRAVFVILTLASFGAFAAVYAMLWWVVPQESAVLRPSGGTLWLLLCFGLSALVIAGSVARLYQLTFTPNGTDLFLPALFLLMSVVFFIRQLGANAS